jgi:hypothetical protein
MYLTHSVRKQPEQSPTQYFDAYEMQVLKKYHPEAEQSLEHAIRALGKLVNFSPTKKQPYPGVKLMAMALNKLTDLARFLRKIE